MFDLPPSSQRTGPGSLLLSSDSEGMSSSTAMVERRQVNQCGVYGIGLKIDVSPPHEVLKVLDLQDAHGRPSSGVLHIGDVLLSVDGTSVENSPASDLEARILGSANSVVRLTLRSRATSKIYDFIAKRHVPIRVWDEVNISRSIRQDLVGKNLLAQPAILDCLEAIRCTVVGPSGSAVDFFKDKSRQDIQCGVGLIFAYELDETDLEPCQVFAIVPGSPASLAGAVLPGDEVIAVDGVEADESTLPTLIEGDNVIGSQCKLSIVRVREGVTDPASSAKIVQGQGSNLSTVETSVDTSSEVTVTVVAARDLPKSPTGLNDPFVCISLMDKPSSALPESALLKTVAQFDHTTDVNNCALNHARRQSNSKQGSVQDIRLIPQIRTRVLECTLDPQWDETFNIKTSYSHISVQPQGDHASEELSQGNLHGQDLIALVTLHSRKVGKSPSRKKSGPEANDDRCGRLCLLNIGSGQSIDGWFPLEQANGTHLMGSSGRPACLHLKLSYNCPRPVSAGGRTPRRDVRQFEVTLSRVRQSRVDKFQEIVTWFTSIQDEVEEIGVHRSSSVHQSLRSIQQLVVSLEEERCEEELSLANRIYAAEKQIADGVLRAQFCLQGMNDTSEVQHSLVVENIDVLREELKATRTENEQRLNQASLLIGELSNELEIYKREREEDQKTNSLLNEKLEAAKMEMSRLQEECKVQQLFSNMEIKELQASFERDKCLLNETENSRKQLEEANEILKTETRRLSSQLVRDKTASQVRIKSLEHSLADVGKLDRDLIEIITELCNVNNELHRDVDFAYLSVSEAQRSAEAWKEEAHSISDMQVAMERTKHELSLAQEDLASFMKKTEEESARKDKVLHESNEKMRALGSDLRRESLIIQRQNEEEKKRNAALILELDETRSSLEKERRLAANSASEIRKLKEQLAEALNQIAIMVSIEEHEKLKHEMCESKELASSLHNCVSVLDGEVESLKQQLKEAHLDVERLENNLGDYVPRSEVFKLQTQAKKLESECRSCKEENARLHKEKHESTSALQAIKVECQEAKDALIQKENESGNLRQDIVRKNNELIELSDKISHLHVALDEEKKHEELARSHKEIARLELMLQQRMEAHQNVVNLTEKYHGEALVLREDLRMHESKAQQAQVAIEFLTNSKKDALLMHDELTNKLNAKQHEFELLKGSSDSVITTLNQKFELLSRSSEKAITILKQELKRYCAELKLKLDRTVNDIEQICTVVTEHGRRTSADLRQLEELQAFKDSAQDMVPKLKLQEAIDELRIVKHSLQDMVPEMKLQEAIEWGIAKQEEAFSTIQVHSANVSLAIEQLEKESLRLETQQAAIIRAHADMQVQMNAMVPAGELQEAKEIARKYEYEVNEKANELHKRVLQAKEDDAERRELQITLKDIETTAKRKMREMQEKINLQARQLEILNDEAREAENKAHERGNECRILREQCAAQDTRCSELNMSIQALECTLRSFQFQGRSNRGFSRHSHVDSSHVQEELTTVKAMLASAIDVAHNSSTFWDDVVSTVLFMKEEMSKQQLHNQNLQAIQSTKPQNSSLELAKDLATDIDETTTDAQEKRSSPLQGKYPQTGILSFMSLHGSVCGKDGLSHCIMQQLAVQYSNFCIMKCL